MRFCIVGTGRCGTSLLRAMIDSHPEVFVFPETHWIPKMFEFFGTGQAPFESLVGILSETRHVNGEPVTRVDPERVRSMLGGRLTTVKEFSEAVGKIFAADAGKPSWSDKTPDYGPHMQTLQILWPECRFVHLVRHGADVARSMSVHPGFRGIVGTGEAWWGALSFNRAFDRRKIGEEEPGLGRFAQLWSLRLRRIRDEATRLRSGSYYEITFEELVAEPVSTLGGTAAFLGLDADESWLRQAAGMVDSGRFESRPAREEVVAVMGEDQRELLDELGYSEKSEPREPTTSEHQLGRSDSVLRSLSERLIEAEEEIESLRAQLRSIEQSRSWRLTAPLRSLAAVWRERSRGGVDGSGQ